MNPFDFFRITSVSPHVHVANPAKNAEETIRLLHQYSDSDLILFPELSISGYTCGELFLQDTLLEACESAIEEICRCTSDTSVLVIVGFPVRIDGRLYNVGGAIQNGELIGCVPKQYLPTYQEFYEGRWFYPGDRHAPPNINFAGCDNVPFGIDVLFSNSRAVVGIEICEDLWTPMPPSSWQAVCGANVLVNLSASNETIGKADYRRSLVAAQSGRCIAGYAYSSSGPSESTTDLVFGGHCLIAECGTIHAESNRVGTGRALGDTTAATTCDVDLQRIMQDRQTVGTMHQARHQAHHQDRRQSQELPAFRMVTFFSASHSAVGTPERSYSGQPFVPSNQDELQQRCREVFDIQCAGLAKRLSRLPADTPIHIGVSGGLDSTLALLVATKTFDQIDRDRRLIKGMTMPGFGTSNKTLTNAQTLMQSLEVSSEQIDIRPLCIQAFRDLKHAPFDISLSDLNRNSLSKSDSGDSDSGSSEFGHGDSSYIDSFQRLLEQLPEDQREDLTFENVQARIRTFLLMSRGFVLGTGDLSEIALGWCTYNADHMSMYNVNCSIPKTLVRFLVRYVAEQEFTGTARECLLSIADSVISPELLPLSKSQQVHQSTEATLGPYELHDFFLYHFVRTGATPAKMLFLAQHAQFSIDYSGDTIRETLKIFLKRFFQNQFKRSCTPDGPKVGSVSLSPRGDWRMPSDADVDAWLQD